MFVQLQNIHGQLKATSNKPFKMIDNYIYLYHTDTLIALPLYPETIQDVMSVGFSQTPIMGRSAPIFSYTGSGPRTMSISLPLHRDMMSQINTASTSLAVNGDLDDDYVDLMVRQLQSMALPRYAASEKMVNPPLVAIRFGNSIFCKGVIEGQVTVEHSGPILTYKDNIEKYAMATVGFSIAEVDPYDADSVQLHGGFRGLSDSLERRVYTGANMRNNLPVSRSSSPFFTNTTPVHTRV